MKRTTPMRMIAAAAAISLLVGTAAAATWQAETDAQPGDLVDETYVPGSFGIDYTAVTCSAGSGEPRPSCSGTSTGASAPLPQRPDAARNYDRQG